MAVMGLRLAAKSNGVSRLHGRTSREMFQPLWPAVPAEETPIGAITNGVHGRTWVSSQMDDLYSKYVSPAWDEAGPDEWDRIDDARDDELWRAREQGRDALVSFVRERLRRALADRGVSVSDAAWADDVLDPALRDRRFLAAVRYLQASHLAAVATGAPARPAARRDRPCSWCSPGRPTLPTIWARR